MTAARMMPFGKHKGVLLADVPTAYLEWLRGLDGLRDPLRQWVDDEWATQSTGRSEAPAPLALEADVAAARRIVEAGYRAEARRHHPDAGGCEIVMRYTNAGVEVLRAWLSAGAA